MVRQEIKAIVKPQLLIDGNCVVKINDIKGDGWLIIQR